MRRNCFLFCGSALVGLVAAGAMASLPATSFTYQGLLSENNAPTQGIQYLSIRLFDTPSGGNRHFE